MPFASKAQSRYMFAKHPGIAKEFAAKTDYKDLPEHSKSKSKRGSKTLGEMAGKK